VISQVTRRAFLTAFKETLAGHLAGAGGIIAGFIVAWQLAVFESVPWAIAVYPAVLIAKAVINGLFSGRLNTALHVGTISPQFAGSMRTLGRMLQRILALTLATSVLMSAVSTVFQSLFWGATPSVFPEILVVVIAAMCLGSTVCLLTIPITFAAFKKGLDLDAVAYPISATIADIFITLCYVLVVNLFFSFGGAGLCIVLLIAIVPVVLSLFYLPRRVHLAGLSRTLRTSVIAMILVAVIASFTGMILQELRVGAGLWDSKSALYPTAIFTAYPALVELVGDAALVIGSTATTRLVLGMLKPHITAMKSHGLQILGAWSASAVAFIPFSAVSLLAARALGLSAFSFMTGVLLVTNAFALVAMTLISYAFAVLTFKKGLDPDHLVIPLETSLAGAMTSTALLAALFLLLNLRG
jgi:mgtE-like transporter